MVNVVHATKITDSVEEEYQDFLKVAESHTTPFYQFNSAFDGTIRSWKDYIEYSFKKFNQFVDIPADTEDHEVHLALPNVRNKLMAILARLSAQRMKSEIHAQNIDQNLDRFLSRYLRYFLEWSDEVSEQDMVNFYWMLETAMKGTGVLCEDYFRYSKEIKDIKIYNPETGKSDWRKKKIEKDGCYSFVIPLEEFYVWNMRLSTYEIDKQYKVYWKSSMELAEVKRVFKKYPRVNDVQPGGILADEEKTFYNKFFNVLDKEQVEILRVWCPSEDSFKIIANNVELTEEDNPLPYKHKKAPTVAAIYEPIVGDFFPGKSLPDKCGNLADSIDQLFNDLFNRNKMQLKAPLTAKKGTTFQDSVWRPDTIIEYTGNEPPQVLRLDYNSQDTDRLFGILTDQLNLSTVSPVTQGQAGSRSTAREVILAQENANELMSMFMRFMEWGERKRVKLRISNLLQFLTSPGKRKEIAGEEKEIKYREFIQYGVELFSGEYGTRIIKFKPSYQITSSKILEKQFPNPEKVEVVEIPLELVQNLDLFIKVVPNSSVKISDSLKKALNLEYVSTMQKFFPDLVNRRLMASELSEDYDKSPERVLKTEQELQEVSPDEQFEKYFGGKKGMEGEAPVSQTLANPLPSLNMNM